MEAPRGPKLPKTAQEGPRTAQDGAKTAPKGPKNTPAKSLNGNMH